MATFIGAVGRQASFVKEVEVGKGGYGLLLATGKGKMLAAWADQTPLTVSDLKKFSNNPQMLLEIKG